MLNKFGRSRRDSESDRIRSDSWEQSSLWQSAQGVLAKAQAGFEQNDRQRSQSSAAKTSDKSTIEKLFHYTQENAVEKIQRLLSEGVPVRSSNSSGQTTLHIAVLWGNHQAAAVLIDAKADVNAKNKTGGTPLHIAASSSKRLEGDQS